MATAKKLPSGKYRCLAYVGKSETCKSGYKSFTADTKKEAERLAANSTLESRDLSSEKKSAGILIDEYIASKTNILSPSTVVGYKSSRNNRNQSLMVLPAEKITSAIAQRSFNEDSRTHSPKTVMNDYCLFTAAFKLAGLSFPQIGLPQKEKKEREIPTQKEVEEMLSLANGDFLLALLLAVDLGLSRSEMCALTLADCKNGKIKIDKAVVKNDLHEWQTKVPKEYARYRTLPMTDRIKIIVDKKQGVPSSPLIPLNPTEISSRFSRLCMKVAGRTYGMHALRHYNVSVMLALNVPPKYIIERTGHATMNMVDKVYGHAFESESEKYAKKINDATQNTTQK